MKMKLPRLLAACDSCWTGAPEVACHPTESVAWAPKSGMWLCDECWAEMENVGEEQDVIPLAFAKDALPTGEEQMQRLIAASAKRRLGVK